MLLVHTKVQPTLTPTITNYTNYTLQDYEGPASGHDTDTQVGKHFFNIFIITYRKIVSLPMFCGVFFRASKFPPHLDRKLMVTEKSKTTHI